jgi:hypothetical protein
MEGGNERIRKTGENRVERCISYEKESIEGRRNSNATAMCF